MDEVFGTLRPLIDLKADPEMVRIDRHQQALPAYHGAYQARMQAITARLQHIPGLHLEANYRGGCQCVTAWLAAMLWRTISWGRAMAIR